MRTRLMRWATGLALAAALAAGIWTQVPGASAGHGAPGHLELLGVAWDSDTVTYKVTVPKSVGDDVAGAIEDAIEDWDLATGMNLVPAEHGKADVRISVRRGGVNPLTGAVGIASVRTRGTELVAVNIKISVASVFFGGDFPTTLVANIARHEFGHALGLGHSDFTWYDPGDTPNEDDPELMSPVIPASLGFNPGATDIPVSTCDANAVDDIHDGSIPASPYEC